MAQKYFPIFAYFSSTKQFTYSFSSLWLICNVGSRGRHKTLYQPKNKKNVSVKKEIMLFLIYFGNLFASWWAQYREMHLSPSHFSVTSWEKIWVIVEPLIILVVHRGVGIPEFVLKKNYIYIIGQNCGNRHHLVQDHFEFSASNHFI